MANTLTPHKALTPKQTRFARLVAEGNSYVDAYAKAYGGNGSRVTMAKEGSRLATLPHISRKIEALNAEIDRKVVYSTLTDRELVLDKLRQCAEGKLQLDPVQLRSIELLGKTCQVFEGREEEDAPTSSRALLEQIRRRLERAAGRLNADGSIEGELVQSSAAIKVGSPGVSFGGPAMSESLLPAPPVR